MADQDAYSAAMREAADAAWDHNWERAIGSYKHAAELAPDDSQALAGLALSLMEAGYTDQALTAYERVSQLVPGDPLPHEKMAEIYSGMGRKGDAAKKYVAVAEIFFARQDLNRAVPYWQSAIDLDADLPQPHMRLAVVYERNKETVPSAVAEYLELARLLQGFGQVPRAEQALQRASKLDPLSNEVRNAIDDLRRGQPLQRLATRAGSSAKKAKTGPQIREDDDDIPIDEGDKEPARSPIDEAARHAMSVLADLIWSGEVPQNAQPPLLQAIDLHQFGDVEGALAAYSKAFDAGLDTPALRLNLGLLNQSAHNNRDAVNLLSQVGTMPEYRLAANLALGLAYVAEDDMPKAARHLLMSLQGADQELNTQYDASGYERMLAGFQTQGRDQLSEISKALALTLNDANWRTKLSGSFAGYVAQGKDNYVPDLIELLVEGGRPEIAEAMERVEMFLHRSLLRLAMEEAHYALERSPDYLPAHRAIADIMIKEGRTQEAATKINLVANTYLMRGNPEKAADLFAEVIQLWPADLGARERVMEMLKSQGRVNEVLRHYTEMGDLFYRLRADPDNAITIYKQALDYASKNNADSAPRVALLKSLADIESQRLNWREAMAAYDEIAQLAPDDEDASLSLVDLHFRMGNSERAIKALDSYMRYCVTHGNTDRVVTTLEEQVRRHPDETALRHRLSDVYQQQKRFAEAIAQMDALGELYLDAGRKSDAIDTIRKIISMNPNDTEGYRQLLEQLES
jgi:tetratricopeptide (TPR) repeat protein